MHFRASRLPTDQVTYLVHAICNLQRVLRAVARVSAQLGASPPSPQPNDASWDSRPPPSPPPPPRIRADNRAAPRPWFFVYRNHHTCIAWPSGRGPGPPRAFSTSAGGGGGVGGGDESGPPERRDENVEFEFGEELRERAAVRRTGRRPFPNTMAWMDNLAWRLTVFTAGRHDGHTVVRGTRAIDVTHRPLYAVWRDLSSRRASARLDGVARHALLSRMYYATHWELSRRPRSPRRIAVLATRINRALAWVNRARYLDIPAIGSGPELAQMRWRYRYLAIIGVLGTRSIPDGLDALRHYFINSSENPAATLTSAMHIFAIDHTLGICISQHFTNSALDLAVDVWDSIEDHVMHRRRGDHMVGSAIIAGDVLRSTIKVLVERLLLSGSPIAWLKRIHEVDPRDRFIRAATLLISCCAQLGVSEKGLEVLRFAQSVNIELPLYIKLTLMHALVVDDSFSYARMVFNTIPDAHDRPEALQEALYLFSNQGEYALATEYVERLKLFGPLDYHHKYSHLRAAAVNGDVERTLALFGAYYQPLSAFSIYDLPTAHKYWMQKFWEMLVAAYYNNSEPDKAEECVQRMLGAGYEYGHDLFNIRLRYYARIGDVKGVSRLWQHALTVPNLQYTDITYLQLMVLCARRGDPEGAAAIMAEAQKGNIPPTRHMIATLMDAYAETRQWRKVVAIFKDLGRGEHANLRRTVEIFNIVLKAYVHMGAPYKMVQRFFEKMVSIEHINPNQITYALLTQSAAETRHYVQARKMYEQMHALARMPTVRDYRTMPMGVMLVSLLPGNARDLFHEMRREGIELQPQTYAALLRVAACRSSGDNNPPRRLLNQILNTTSIARLSGVERENALQRLYAPVMRLYSKQGDMTNLQQLHDDMLHRGGSPSIVTLWLMMDGHRIVGDLEKVQELWEQIFKLAVESRAAAPTLISAKAALESTSRTLVSTKAAPEAGSSLLCVPLSTYIHALSAAGMHNDISRVWKEVRDEGFTFDANNWTVLCTALVEAGKLDRAYEILERVLVPAQQHAEAARFTLNEGVGEGATMSPPGPLELGVPTADARRRLTMARFYQSYLSKDKRRELLKRLYRTRDMLSPLVVLGEISPLWNSWRTHAGLLRLLYEKTQEVLRSKEYMQRFRRTGTMETLQRLRAALTHDYPLARRLVDKEGRAARERWLARKRELERPRWRDYRKWLVWSWLARRVRYSLPQDATDRRMRAFVAREHFLSAKRQRVPWVGYRAWLARWQTASRAMLLRREHAWKRRGRPLEHGGRQQQQQQQSDVSRRASGHKADRQKKNKEKRQKEKWEKKMQERSKGKKRQGRRPPQRAEEPQRWQFQREERKKKPKQPSRTVFWS